MTPVQPVPHTSPILEKREARTRRSRVRSAPVDFEQHQHDRINRIPCTGSPAFSTTHHHHCQSHSNRYQKHQPYQLKKPGCGVSPSSPPLDPNNATRTRTIFGSLALFDGSPTYKQRRRRAVSTSSSINQSQHVTATEVEPIRARRHINCHLRINPSPPNQQRPTKGLRSLAHHSNLHRSHFQPTIHANHQLDRPTQQLPEATPQCPVATQQPAPIFPGTQEFATDPGWLKMIEDTSFVALKDMVPSQGSTDRAPDASGLYDMDPPARSSLTSSLYSPANTDMEINNGSISNSGYMYNHPVFASPGKYQDGGSLRPTNQYAVLTDLNQLPYSASPGTLFWSDEEGYLSPSSLSSSLTSPSSILHYQNYNDPSSHPSHYSDGSALLLPLAPAMPYQCLDLPTNHLTYYAPVLPAQSPTPHYDVHLYNTHSAYDTYSAIDKPLFH